MGPSSTKPPGKNTKTSSKTTSKDKVGKVSSSKTPVTPAQQKKEVKERIRKLQFILGESHASYETAKLRFQEITKAYDNGANPEHKDEYEKQDKALNAMAETLKDYESQLDELMIDQRVLEDMDGVEKTVGPSTLTSNSDPDLASSDPASSNPAGSDPSGSLFVSSDPAGSSGQQDNTSSSPAGSSTNALEPPAGPPVINLVNEDGAPDSPPIDKDPEDAGLFTPEQNRVVSGRIDEAKVAAWRMQGYSKQVIIRHGPKNSPKYDRSTKTKAGIPFDEKTTDQFGPDHRFGDEKEGRKFVRRWDDFKGILGVAYNCPLNALAPREKGDGRKYPRVEVWVKWSIYDEIRRVWEVPSSIKHIFPNATQCEEYIYNAACDHAKKHQAWKSGQREGREASPTPGPEMNRLMPKGPQVTGKGIKIEKDGSNGPLNSIPSEEERMLQFRQQWAMMQNPKLDSENLTMKQMFTFIKAWNEWKDEEEL